MEDAVSSVNYRSKSVYRWNMKMPFAGFFANLFETLSSPI